MSAAAENTLPPAFTPERILLIRLKSMGDVVLTLPAVHAIRESFPRAKITFLVSKENAPLLAGFAPVNEIIALDRARFRRKNPVVIVAETLSLLRRLRRGRFSLAVDFQGYGETGLLTWCTRARHRWGNVYQPVRGWAYTRRALRDRTMHPADWHRSLLEQCGLSVGRVRNEFTLPEAPLAEARALLASHRLDITRPTAFIQPFTSATKKNWPLEKFLDVAATWRRSGLQVAFGGGPADRAALEPALSSGYPVFAGVPLLTAAGLMQLSSIVIGGDTGLPHLAVAMGKRVVMIMKRYGPGATVPYQHPDWIVEPPEGALLKFLEPAAVLDAVARALNETAPARQCH